MTTLQDELDQRTLSEAILNLTNDLDAVSGVKVTSATSAEIWVSNASVSAVIKARCAEHDVLHALTLTFREELDEATAPGGAAEKPRSWESKDAERTSAPSDSDGPTPEVGD